MTSNDFIFSIEIDNDPNLPKPPRVFGKVVTAVNLSQNGGYCLEGPFIGQPMYNSTGVVLPINTRMVTRPDGSFHPVCVVVSTPDPKRPDRETRVVLVFEVNKGGQGAGLSLALGSCIFTVRFHNVVLAVACFDGPPGHDQQMWSAFTAHPQYDHGKTWSAYYKAGLVILSRGMAPITGVNTTPPQLYSSVPAAPAPPNSNPNIDPSNSGIDTTGWSMVDENTLSKLEELRTRLNPPPPPPPTPKANHRRNQTQVRESDLHAPTKSDPLSPASDAPYDSLPDAPGDLSWSYCVSGILFLSRRGGERRRELLFINAALEDVADIAPEAAEHWETVFNDQAARLEALAMAARVAAQVVGAKKPPK